MGDLLQLPAGSYNIEHPDTAKELGQRKVKNLMATNPDVIATGNIGCLNQIEFHSQGTEKPVPIPHSGVARWLLEHRHIAVRFYGPHPSSVIRRIF